MTAPAIENFRASAALSYADRGWHVMPLHHAKVSPTATTCSCGMPTCTSPAKHPRTDHGLLDATTDPEVVRRWWREWPASNVGVRTGAISGFVVVDVDPRHGGDEALHKLISQHGPIPPTVEAETGGGGSHFLFAHPGQRVPNQKSVAGKASRLGLGLDVRGDGGYIVAPPSNHKSGVRYAWAAERSPEDVDVAPVPAWLLPLIVEPAKPFVPRPGLPAGSADGIPPRYWLRRAIAEAAEGSRNDVGFWFFCQLRDNGVSEAEAGEWARAYVSSVPQGGTPYTLAEAEHSLRQAYRAPRRQPSGGLRLPPPKSSAPKPLPPAVIAPPAPPAEPTPAVAADPEPVKPAATPADEFRVHLEEVFAGRFYNVAFPWPQLTQLGQALLPGSMMVICGDPGVGKTYLVLDCLRFWFAAGVDAYAYFLEKDRKFYIRRLMAQLMEDGRYVDYDWLPYNADLAKAAWEKHKTTLNDLGACIGTPDGERVTLDDVLATIEHQAAAGKRVIVVDPITAVAAGAERWTKDDDFVIRAGKVLVKHGASLILVTHTKQGLKAGTQANGHSMAGGSAYFRFCDTQAHISRTPKPRTVECLTSCGMTRNESSLFFQFNKTRDGRGAGSEVAFDFKKMRFVEFGMVTKVCKNGERPDDDDPFEAKR